ncbi:heme biosynthesis protein [Pseudoalteromonas piscicida]|uniref:Heme biosynthesis protein n=1 Tax=Pseudoalteromonas piscicida TaxID=43662 RepID=A0AAQ2EXM2_PSEO7|nr:MULTISPECIES: heme biosynthesis HemY N-terminal domain-containing protein [Pseudoalteromonas]KJY91963.1 heme biosynthesis protein [Pseudoalteromonas piscicida]TMN41603.1 heme biosynthesis protein [Pseudoalteromonas piscicida]TMN44699.1 heme biosynthesis protein [Pseudoalteromonas piscicida]TMN49070.1 heme biosynthesis protein [Pseudoalteromonas piscicida]TMN51421.1 heme biosynthesis protein [Pseudoalteromonas piscicida]
MMAKIITFALIFIALAASHLLIDEKGYVLISFNQTTIEGSIVSFTILLLLAITALVLLGKVVRWSWHRLVNTKGHFSRKRKLKALQVWNESLWLFINGEVEQAATLLTKTPQPDERQDYVRAIAAKAALKQGDVVKANTELEAISDDNQGQLAALWLEANNSEQALALLDDKMSAAKPTSAVLSGYILACLQAKQPELAAAQIAKWHKKLNWSDTQWQSVFERMFVIAPEQADTLFNTLPKAVKAHAIPALNKVKLQQGRIAEVLGELKKLLKQGQYHQLADYLQHSTQSSNELKLALQQQLKKHPDDKELLFSLACLCNAEGDYELAAKIFDSLSANPWEARWSKQAQLAYEKMHTYEKAYLIAKS